MSASSMLSGSRAGAVVFVLALFAAATDQASARDHEPARAPEEATQPAPPPAQAAPSARLLDAPRNSKDAHFSARARGAAGSVYPVAADASPTPEPQVAKGRDAVYSVRSREGMAMPLSSRNPGAALLVLVRDRETGVLMSLALSSEASAETLVHREGDEIWGTLGVGLPLPPPPPLPPPAMEAIPALEYPRGDGRSRTMARVLPWLALGTGAPVLMGGLIDADAEAAARAPTCAGSCETIVKDGVVVLARGLPPGHAEMVAASLASRGAEPHAALLGVAQDARRWWPSRTPIRSAVVDRGGAGQLPAETLVVPNDPRGRANARLSRMHTAHMGGTHIPALLETAAQTDDLVRRAELLQEAIVLGRIVTRENPTVALWQANLALAYAMASARDDRAVIPMRAALQARPRDVAVLVKVAAVHVARGDLVAAERMAKQAIKLAPDNGEAQRLVEVLRAE